MTLLTLPHVRRRASIGAPAVAPWQLLVLADGAVAAMVGVVFPARQALLFAAVLFLTLAIRGCYRPRFSGAVGAILWHLVTSVAIAALAVGATFPSGSEEFLRVSPIIAVTLVIARCLAGIGVRAMRVRAGGEPTLIVGAGATGARMAANLLAHPQLGLHPVGIVDDVPDEDLALPLLGGTDQLEAIARAFDVRHVVVTFGRTDEVTMVDVLRRCRSLDAQVWVVPRLFELGSTLADADELWGVPVGKLNRAALRTSQWHLKRAFDITVSATLLLLAAPLMLAIAAAVKLTSPGPVFFRQRRVGQEGRIVDVLKFRSMRVNDDSDRTWNVTSDPRVTAIGRVLRPTSLDELPQLLNVLRGDMSLVGPRPERPHFVELFSGTIDGYQYRHRVPVGLTGLSQVNGLRGDTSIEDRVRFDNLYIENWSLWTDLVILVRTVWAVLRPPADVKITDGERTDGATVIDLRTHTDLDPELSIPS